MLGENLGKGKRDFQLKNTLKKYRTKDEEEEHRLRRKLARQKERSMRKDKKSKRKWKERMKSKISNKSGDFQGGTPVMLKPLSKSKSPPFVALENHPSSSPVTLQKEDSPNKGNVRSTKKKGRGLRVDHGQEIDLKALDSKRNFDRPEAADSFSVQSQ